MNTPRGARGRVLLAGVVALVLAACGSARDEDVLVIYSAGPRPLAEAVAEAYTEATGVRVELFAATTGQIMAKLEAERYRPRADVVVFASRVAAEALSADDRLLAYPDPAWLEHTEQDWHDPGHRFFGTSAALVGIAFREDALDEDADWLSMFHGGGLDRVTMPSPSRSGAAGDFVVAWTLAEGDASWDAYLAARRGGLDFAAANSQAIGGLVVGAYNAILGAVDYLIYRQIEQGAPLVMHYPASGSALVQRPVAILADTPVPERAREFVDFYFTPEMQALVAAQHLLPARHDVAPSDARRAGSGDAPPPVIAIDYDEALQQQTPILRRFQLRIERAEVVHER